MILRIVLYKLYSQITALILYARILILLYIKVVNIAYVLVFELVLYSLRFLSFGKVALKNLFGKVASLYGDWVISIPWVTS